MSAGAAFIRARPLLRRRSLRALPRRLLVALAVVAGLAAGYFFYLRDSSLVAVTTVQVEGVDPALPGAARLETEIERAAREMTTLHVKPGLVEEAVGDSALVRSVSIDASFPHKLTVDLVERRPAAIVGAGAGAVVAAEDGTLLRDLPAGDVDLPLLAGFEPPPDGRLGGHALEAASVLGAAPRALAPFLAAASFGADGLLVSLTDGIELRFGDASQAAAKWSAAAGVLADPNLTALDYVDLSSPQRPAVGGDGHALPPAP